MGGGGCDSGCGQWWLVAMSVGSDSGLGFAVGFYRQW